MSSSMKVFITAVWLLLSACPSLFGQAEQVAASVSLLGAPASEFKEMLSKTKLFPAEPEYESERSINYVQYDGERDRQLKASLRDGQVTGMGWWFRGGSKDVNGLVRLQKEMELKLFVAGYKTKDSAAEVDGEALFGDLAVGSGRNQALIVRRLYNSKTRTLIELDLRLPLAGSAGNEQFELGIAMYTNVSPKDE